MPKSPFNLALNKQNIAIGLLILFILIGLSWFVVTGTVISSWDFRNNLWTPAHLLLQGQSPYDIAALFDASGAVWMPTIIGALFPIGLLPLQQATNLWFLVSIFSLLLLTWASANAKRPAPHLLAIALLASFLFPPTISHLQLGQFSLGIALLFILIVRWQDKTPPLLLAFLLTIALAKPQLAVLVLPGFLYAMYTTQGIRPLTQFLGQLAAVTVVLTIPLFIAYPNWLADFVIELQQNPTWDHPSSLRALTVLVPTFGLILWLILAATVFAINLRLWARLPRQEVVLWSLALTPLVSPYVWSWDFVLLLPLFIASLFQIKKVGALVFLLLGYIGCWVLIVNLALSGDVSNFHYWWVPWLLGGIIVVARLGLKSPNFNANKPPL